MVMLVDLMARFFFGTGDVISRGGDSFELAILEDPLLFFTITIFFVMGLAVETGWTTVSSVGF